MTLPIFKKAFCEWDAFVKCISKLLKKYSQHSVPLKNVKKPAKHDYEEIKKKWKKATRGELGGIWGPEDDKLYEHTFSGPIDHYYTPKRGDDRGIGRHTHTHTNKSFTTILQEG